MTSDRSSARIPKRLSVGALRTRSLIVSLIFEHGIKGIDEMRISKRMPVQFLSAETRCDYFISEDMKKIWACQLDLLERVQEVCLRHGIKFFMLAGSLLGAIRHKGFIPWDDDIDIGMLREDYDKFLKIAPDELSHPYFLQAINTEPECVISFAKLRNSDTTAIFDSWIWSWHSHMNQGIFIDIFPIDGIPRSSMGLSVMKIIRKVLSHIRHHSVYWRKGCKICNAACRVIVLLCGYQRVCKLIGWTYRIFSVKRSRQCGLVCWREEVLRRFQWRSDIFNDLIEVPFEYLKVPIPRSYNECLQQSYGDWHKLVRGGSLHEGTLYDVNRSYKDVLVEKFGYSRRELCMSELCHQEEVVHGT